MAQNRSDKSPYQSRFGAGWISGAQFLAENMCSRKARSDGSELPLKFWQDPYWEKQLKLQLLHANKLLESFEMPDILTGLKHPDAKKVYSLGLKSVLIPLIKRAKKLRLSQERQIASIPKCDPLPSVDITQKPRVPFSTNKNKLQSLRDLDNN